VTATLRDQAPEYLDWFTETRGLGEPPAPPTMGGSERDSWRWFVATRLTRLRDIEARLWARKPGGHPDGWGRTNALLLKDLLLAAGTDGTRLMESQAARGPIEAWAGRVERLAREALEPEDADYLLEVGFIDTTWHAPPMDPEMVGVLTERGIRLAEMQTRLDDMRLRPGFDARDWASTWPILRSR